MAMELIVKAPELAPVEWNYEELKTAVATKLEDYKGLQYTPDQMVEAKKDRANLRKLQTALNDKKKEVKKICMQPYTDFENQIKEVMALIDEPVVMIDTQVKEYEEAERQEKQRKISDLWYMIQADGYGYTWIALEEVQKPEWLNKSYSMAKIEEEIRNTFFRMGADLATINTSGENSVIALNDYKVTKDLNHALQKMHEFEAQEKAKAKAQEEQAADIKPEEEPPLSALPEESDDFAKHMNRPEKRMRVTFTVTAFESQFEYLNAALSDLKDHAEELIIVGKKVL